MAQAESNQVVQSYLEGLRNTLTRQQLAMEQNRANVEAQQRQQQIDLATKQFQEEQTQRQLANKAAEAQMELQFRQGLSEHPLSEANADRDAQGNIIKDENGNAQFSIADPYSGKRFSVNAPTAEQMRNIQLLQAGKVAQQESDIAQKRELAVAGQAQEAAKGLETQRTVAEAARTAQEGDIQKQVAKMNEDAEMGRTKAENATRLQIARIEQGYETGAAGSDIAGDVATHIYKVLHGEETDKDLAILKPGIRQQVVNGVTAAGGVITKDKDIAAIKSLAGVVPFFEDSRNAISAQPDAAGGRIGGYLTGEGQNILDPTTSQKFSLLSGNAPKIAQTIGGEAGQRLTDFKVNMSNNAFTPSITDLKSMNIQKYNNGVGKVLDSANETLANYPAQQRAMILQQYAFHTLQPYGTGQATGAAPQTQTGQTQAAPQGQTQYTVPQAHAVIFGQ